MISAGSILEIMMEKRKISFPVGRVEYLYLFPMCFEEFLLAMGEQAALHYYRETPVPALAHDKLTKLFRLYSFIGGMLEAVTSLLRIAKNPLLFVCTINCFLSQKPELLPQPTASGVHIVC